MGVGTGLALLSLGASVVGAVGQFREAQQRADAENFNAAVARQEAALAKQSGQIEAGKQRRFAGKLRGAQKAGFSKAGVTLSGSAVQTIDDSAAEAELDALVIEYNAEVSSSARKSEADFRESTARKIRQGALLNLGTSLLTSTSSFLVNNFGGAGQRGTVPGTNKTQSEILGFDTRKFR